MARLLDEVPGDRSRLGSIEATEVDALLLGADIMTEFPGTTEDEPRRAPIFPRRSLGGHVPDHATGRGGLPGAQSTRER